MASSTAGVGRQSTLINNATTRYRRVIVYLNIKQGASPTGGRFLYVYGIRGDGTIRSDGAGASDAAFTRLNAVELGVLANKASPSTGDLLTGEFVFENPGPEWGIAIVHDIVASLDGTEGNHAYTWVGVNPEVQ
ncbi:MAG: hypothetical protein IPJ00_21240 [Saprospirales bacterium]|nr:hypothetical protein [Saprospirales bacterium]